MFTERWVKVERNNRRRPFVYPLKIFWDGFHSDNGRQRRIIELNDGRLITDRHSSYHFWEKKIKTSK
jgi:hypothetical protein